MAPARLRPGVVLPLTGAASILLLLSALGPGDPVADVISDYALHPSSAPWFALCVLLLATGGTAALTGLPRSWAFRAWQGGAVLCVVFPANADGESTFSGDVHRLAGGALLASLPVVGWGVARWAGATGHARTVARLSLLVLVTALLFGVSHLTASQLGVARGLFERMTVFAQAGLLLAIAATPRLVPAKAESRPGDDPENADKRDTTVLPPPV